MLNWGLLKHPLNWFIVLLMLIIAGFVIDIVAMAYQKKHAVHMSTAGVAGQSQ